MKELNMIREYYGDKVAKRSGVPLINHIHEGLEILRSIGASVEAKKAYYLHPMLQSDEALVENLGKMGDVNYKVLILAMEYRKTANAYLSHRHVEDLRQIQLSPLLEVNQMLYADKVQNQKDFLKYHYGTHERSEELKQYFENWIIKLENHLNIKYENTNK